MVKRTGGAFALALAAVIAASAGCQSSGPVTGAASPAAFGTDAPTTALPSAAPTDDPSTDLPTPAPTTQAPAPVYTPPAPPAETVSQSNAVSKAQDYLDYTSFSRQSLINQLMFEGFSNADATYAVDKVNPDWNEQAAKKAKEYLDYTSFSHDGLLQQLIYEGFTPDQAAYGVSQTGLSATTLPPAPAGTVSLSTFNGGGDLNVRSGPGSANALVGTVSDGGSISALCQTTGEDIEGPGGETATWVKILAPANGWVSAAFISSPITLPSC